jgi:hypothetical protein
VYGSYDEQYWGDGPQGQGRDGSFITISPTVIYISESHPGSSLELQAAFEDGR